jgi:hypothetical protein
MQTFNDKTARHQFAFAAYGIELRICTNSRELLEHVRLMLPSDWRRRPRAAAQDRLGILHEGGDVYSVYRPDGMCIHDAPGKEYALAILESQIEGHVALGAKDYVFIHAGAVADNGRAIVVPGMSFSGKTSLVRALVEAGATYYSDEFAVLDEAGRVLPYSRRLSIRRPVQGMDPYPVEHFGGAAGVDPLPIGLAIVTRYRPGADWQPRRLSPGAGALAVLEHAVPAQDRPKQTLRVLKQALAGAVILEGERGEGDELAHVLLDTLRAAA